MNSSFEVTKLEPGLNSSQDKVIFDLNLGVSFSLLFAEPVIFLFFILSTEIINHQK